MKKILFVLLLSFSGILSFAAHIKGGFFSYQYLGAGINDPSKLRYKITLTVYSSYNPSVGPPPSNQIFNVINFTIFQGNTTSQFALVSVNLTRQFDLDKNYASPCITGSNLTGHYYSVFVYELNDYELPVSPDGYTISYQKCCRLNNMDNLTNSGGVGNTWSIHIPGSVNPILNGDHNSSPIFPVDDTVLVCANHSFTYSFGAVDPDGDSLSYVFCSAFTGGTTTIVNPDPSDPPPYISVPYSNPYFGSQPMGIAVSINANTGLITGIAPPIINTGEYVISVCVYEYRNGVFFAQTRKELHVRVKDCDPLHAVLKPEYHYCNGYTASFDNGEGSNPSGVAYLWNFGDPSTGANNTSTLPTPTHTYSDTGTYILKLKITLSGICTDSATALVKVYPGFFPGFTVSGQCKNTPIQFFDTTKATYGLVNAWRWDFGDLNTTADTSHLKNPTYIYPASGNYDVQFIVQSNKGCIDTVNKTVVIQDKPALTLSNDTLICVIDTLQLNAVGAGNIFWTPNYNINNQTSFTPLVSPDVPTKYYATLTDPFGCVGRDSVFVNVVSNVFINAGNDTTICKTDAITINTVSNAVNYLWTPSTYLNSDTAKNPLATPLATTTYYVTGSIGKCNTKDSITINVVPYPAAFAGNDTTICYGDFAQLEASGGSIYNWSPTLFLNNPNIPNPVSTPRSSIRYIVSVGDNLGCPKIVKDTVLITVQRVTADAGPRDTIIVRNQPLQLNGTGGQIYLWSPATGLDNPNIYNPIANITGNVTYVLTASTAEGCFATDTISVIVYNVPAGLYVPNAFTPNGDGINDVFRPIPIGMKEISNFKVFNRWGELVFSTSIKLQGWDGNYKGRPQDPAVYVWLVEGIDYQDKKTKQKGTVVLIR